MTSHNGVLFGGSFIPHAYLAVDFFFMLSGFVLAAAYQQRLDGGWPTSRFLEVRLIRLFPLYLCGLVISVIHYARIDRSPLSWEAFGLPLLVSLLMFPGTPWVRSGFAYAFNFPCWSLGMELIANFSQVLFLRNKSTRFLSVAVGTAGVAMAYVVVRFGTVLVGADMSQVIWGMPRAIFPYLLGMLLFRMWRRQMFAVRVPTTVILIVFLAAITGLTPGKFDAFYDLGVILSVFPAILLLAANAVVSPKGRSVADVMGRSSYGMYVLHFPLQLWWPILLHRLHLDGVNQHVPFDGIVFLLFTFVLAVLLDRFYDGPIRELLVRRGKRTGAGYALKA